MSRRWWLLVAVTLFSAVWLTPQRSGATVADQRRRLPPAAHCDDPVAGVWKAHVYFQHVRSWYLLTLDIRRDASDKSQLLGPIRSELWEGTPDDEEPPACAPGGEHLEILCEGAGSTDDAGKRLTFGGVSCRFGRAYCGSPSGNIVLATYSGPVDHERQEFQSEIFSDSPTWQNIPTVFRRIRCAGEPGPDRVIVTPPIAPPEKRSRSCSCSWPGA